MIQANFLYKKIKVKEFMSETHTTNKRNHSMTNQKHDNSSTDIKQILVQNINFQYMDT